MTDCPTYKILSAPSPEQLMTAVQNHLKAGFELVGGASVDQNAFYQTVTYRPLDK